MDSQWVEGGEDAGGWDTVRRTFQLTMATLVVTAVVYGAWILTSWWIHPG